MMHLDLSFDRPLNREAKTSLLLAVAALAKARSVRFVRGDHGALIFGEALGRQTMLEALAAEGVVPVSVGTSLDEVADSVADEQPDRMKERVRAIGR